MTTFTLQRQIEWTPAQTITACVEILLRTRADLLFSLPPSNEAHVTLSRARREFPEVFDDDISAQLQRWQDNS